MHIHVDTSEIAKALRGTCAAGSNIPEPVSYKIGSRVQIVPGPCALEGRYSYRGKYIGYFGEIVRLPELQLCSCNDEGFTPTIGVLIDGRFNERSQYGCYWFRPEELHVITDKEVKENNKMILLKGYKIAQVATEGYGDQYVAHYEETLEEGDRVVVADDKGYHCGIVSNVSFITDRIPKFQIVCKINDSAFCERNDRAKKAKELESKLKTAVADYQQIALYEMLAEKSPEIASLLQELKEVTNG